MDYNKRINNKITKFSLAIDLIFAISKVYITEQKYDMADLENVF